jgi:E3 ubiquitin-protein ligase TRIP12
MNVSDLILNTEETRRRSRSFSDVNNAGDGLAEAATSGDVIPVADAGSSNVAAAASSSWAQVTSGTWAVQFSVDSVDVPTETTIFGLAFASRSRQLGIPNPNVWDSILTIQYRKVSTPLLSTKPVEVYKEPLTMSPIHNKSLEVMKLLHDIYVAFAPSSDCSYFINRKIAAKLVKQLEEPLIVVSRMLPSWCDTIVQNYSFLVSFESRLVYLQSTSFGYSRSISRLQSQSQNNNVANNGDFMTVGRVQRQKIRVDREKLILSMMKMMSIYGMSQAFLEIEFVGEVGTGLGPTLEFYSQVCQQVRKVSGVELPGMKKPVHLWRNDSNAVHSGFIHAPEGLFPAPMDPRDKKMSK